MITHTHPRTRPRGATSGSPSRSAHRVADLPLAFDLPAELRQLRAEQSWEEHGRNAKTLVKESDLRVVLLAMKRGARLDRHRAPGRLALQTLAGRLRSGTPAQTVELPAGQLFLLDREVPHDVEALELSAFLLTMARPDGETPAVRRPEEVATGEVVTRGRAVAEEPPTAR